MQAVLKPASARPKAARRPEPPAPTTMASYSWSYKVYQTCANSSIAERTYNDRVFVANERGSFLRPEGRVSDNSRYTTVSLLKICGAEIFSHIPAGLVEEKVLVWFFNALENWIA
jgi:hypothetical protein